MTTLSYEDALEHVKSQVSASRSSFRTGMAILPKKRREGMYGLYGFCRAVDDIADDSPDQETASRELEKWRRRIADVFNGTPTNAVTTVLLPAITTFELREKDFHDIIDGMEMDAETIVAPDDHTLDLYCDRVASAVGRVSVRIFGDSSRDALQVAHHLGRAFQLTNILRDLAEDAKRGRLYLPSDLLEKHGIETHDPAEVLKHANLAAVCRDLADDTREQYQWADECMNKCSHTAMRPARIMRSYYGAIFNELRARNWQDVSVRVSLPKLKKMELMLKGLFA